MTRRREKRKRAQEQRKREQTPYDPHAARRERLARLRHARRLREKIDREKLHKTRQAEIEAAKRNRPVMLVIAEKACGPREIRKILEDRAADLAAQGKSRRAIIGELNHFCDLHDYGDFQRRKTIMDVAKRAVSKRQTAQWREWEVRNTASHESRG